MSTAEPFMPNIDPERERSADQVDETAEVAEVDADLAAASAEDDVATGEDAEVQDPTSPETRESVFRTPTPGDSLDPEDLDEA